jgi:flagellar hook-associated protein 2
MASAALPPVTSLGSGSNLPLQDILTQLQDSEEQQLTLIKNQQSLVTAQISAYGQLQSAITGLQTAAKTLADPSTYAATKATVTGEDFTATTKTGAIASTYTVQVEQLATGQSLQSGAFTSRTAPIGAAGGTITVTVNGKANTVTLGTDTSLNGVASAINSSDTIGMRATVINDGNGNSYLLLAAKDTGTKAAITSIVASDSTLNGKIGYTAGSSSPMTETTVAQDAKLKINNVEVTSGSNTVTDAIDDVTLTLTAASNTPNTLGMTIDTSAQSNAVHAFVTAYNTLRNLISADTAFDTADDTSSVLTGDATVRSVQSTMASALRVLTSGNIGTIQDLGITTDTTTPNGLLSVDDITLTNALTANPGDAQEILGGTSGLGALMSAATDNLIGSDGILASRTDGLNQTAKTLKDNFDTASDRIDADIANLRAKFVALDSFVAQMNSTSTYLTQQFASLSQSTK